MRTLNLKDPNPFYAPASDECWVILAKEIMASYACKYMCLLPTTAFSQTEYDKLNKQTYSPMRRHVLKNIKNGPLRNVVDMTSVYSGLERRRMEYKKSLNISWRDNFQEDLDTL